MIIQNHAIERYVQYYTPGLPDSEVYTLLQDMLQRAVRTKAKSSCGDFIWTCDGVRFVIKHDRGMKADKGGARSTLNKNTYCVTVLPPQTPEVYESEVDPEAFE